MTVKQVEKLEVRILLPSTTKWVYIVAEILCDEVEKPKRIHACTYQTPGNLQERGAVASRKTVKAQLCSERRRMKGFEESPDDLSSTRAGVLQSTRPRYVGRRCYTEGSPQVDTVAA